MADKKGGGSNGIKMVLGMLIGLAMVVGILGGIGYVAKNFGSKIAEKASQMQRATEQSMPESEEEFNPMDNRWTIMVFMCGSDLESDGGNASDDLVEAMSATKPENLNFVVETGGAKEWAMEGIPSDELARYHLRGEELALDETVPLASMGDPSTLSDFIRWSKKNYPADHYMLILWDHGGGSILGINSDELFEGDGLSLLELDQALNDADTHFDLISMDACLMATLETADVLCKYSDYMGASEELMPGYGMDYTAMVNAFADNPQITATDLGRELADSFYRVSVDNEMDAMVTYSVIDLSKIEEVKKAFRLYTSDLLLSTADADTLQNIIQRIDGAEYYGEDPAMNMLDLGSMVKNTNTVTSSSSRAVLDALDDAVVYEIHGDGREQSNGLSVFYPLDQSQECVETFAQLTDNKAYLEYISVVNGTWDKAQWQGVWSTPKEREGYTDTFIDGVLTLSPVDVSDVQLGYTLELDENNCVQMMLSGGLSYVNSVRFLLYYVDEETGNEMYLGEDNDLYADYENGVFTDNFHGTWIGIGGEFVNANILEITDAYTLYKIPAIVNDRYASILARYVYDTKQYDVIGYTLESDSDMASRDMFSMKEGDRVTFLFTVYSQDGQDGELIEGETITWSDATNMEDIEIAAGHFLYVFEIEDIFGNLTVAEPVDMTIDNGQIYVDLGTEAE